MDLPIVDTHIHFWNPDQLSYPWLAKVPAISGPHLPQDLALAARDVNLQGIVFVQAGAADDDWLAEAQWVTALAEEEPLIRGIVAHAPLELGDGVRPYLDALAELPLVKGVRRLVQGEDVDFCVQPGFVRGVQLLADYGFSFDHTIHHEQAENTIRLVEMCPDVSIVLDHFGKPPVQAGELEPWRSHLRTLAGFPNLHCKLSGLATEADHDNWTRDQLRPYIDAALECFGTDRVFYGGDWPVSTLAIGYKEWLDVLDWVTQGYDLEVRLRIFAENARAVYRLA